MQSLFQILRYYLRHASVVFMVLTVLTVPGFVTGQETSPDAATGEGVEGDDEELTAEEEGFVDYLATRGECLDRYRFGSVTFDFGQAYQERLYRPGQTVELAGLVHNSNDYPLPQGKIIARVLRYEPTVGARDWHPVVAEQVLTGDYSLAAQSSRAFTFAWPVPAAAPAGGYRVEFYYLVGGRYVLAGIPYTANFPGGVAGFSVQNADLARAITFDRSSVLLAGEPLALRAVPPTLNADAPITVAVKLTAEGPTSVPVTLTKTLYEWSDTDQDPPLSTDSTKTVVTSGKPLTVSFTWDAPQAGVYELVLSAQPDDPAVLPTLVKVRFPVFGNTPRVIYAGVGAIEGGAATITTCVVNGTTGEGTGTVKTTVRAGEAVVAETTGQTEAGGLSTTNVQVPLAQLAGVSTVDVEAADEQGRVTDRHTVTYGAGVLAAAAAEDSTQRGLVMAAVVIGLLVVALIGAWLMRRRNATPVPPPSSPVSSSPPL